MKHLFYLLIGLVVTISVSAQTTKLEGQLLNINSPVNIRVFEYQTDNNWHLVEQVRAGETYALSLRQDRDYQIWFTDSEDFTKVLAVNRHVIEVRSFDINVDFNNTSSVQITKTEAGLLKFSALETDFTVLKSPWDLYCI